MGAVCFTCLLTTYHGDKVPLKKQHPPLEQTGPADLATGPAPDPGYGCCDHLLPGPSFCTTDPSLRGCI